MNHNSNSFTNAHNPEADPHLLREIMLTNQALLKIFSHQVGLPASQLIVLRLMALSHPQPLGVIGLAGELGVNPAAVTRRVGELENRNLLTRERDPQDNRKFFLRLTTRGLETFEMLHARAHDLEERLEEGLTPEEINCAKKVLKRFRAGLEEFTRKESS